MHISQFQLALAPQANAAHLPTLLVCGVWGICKLCMHFFIAYQTFLWKWRNDHRSERNLCNSVKKPQKKIQDFNGVWTRDLIIPVWYSTNWAMKPLTLGACQLWVHRFPWKKWVFMIYEKLYMNCGNEMKMKWSSQWTQFMQLRKEAWKNSGLQRKMKSLSMDKENGSLSGIQKTSATASKLLLSFAAFWLRKEDDHSKYFKPSVAKRLKNMGIYSLPHIEIFWGFRLFLLAWRGSSSASKLWGDIYIWSTRAMKIQLTSSPKFDLW